MMTDPIADMLTRIRNANKAKLEKVEMPSSKMKVNISKILEGEGFIKDFEVISDDKQGLLRIYLKYDQKGGIITQLKRISKSGCRVYVKREEIRRVLNGLGVAVLSTPKGILTDRAARKLNVGGELLFFVW